MERWRGRDDGDRGWGRREKRRLGAPAAGVRKQQGLGRRAATPWVCSRRRSPSVPRHFPPSHSPPLLLFTHPPGSKRHLLHSPLPLPGCMACHNRCTFKPRSLPPHPPPLLFHAPMWLYPFKNHLPHCPQSMCFVTFPYPRLPHTSSHCTPRA